MARSKVRLLSLSAAAVTVALIAWQNADACTRILWNDNKLAVVVGRTLDWPESTEPVLTVFPRGITRNGGQFGTENVVKKNPADVDQSYLVFGIGPPN